MTLVYLAATIAFQFAPLSRRLLWLDQFGVLPRWKFFVPLADRIEPVVQLRTGPTGDTLGDWAPLPLYSPRDAVSWLWFPSQHRSTVLWLSAHYLARRVIHGDAERATQSLASRTLARHIRQTGAIAFQFALIHPNREGDARSGTVIFTSPVHPN